MVKKSFRKNSIILTEGQTKSFMYFIESGKVKVVQTSDCGREQIIAIHGKDEFFGEMALLDGKTLPARIVAMEDCRIALLTEKDFREHFLKNITSLKEIVELLCRRLRDAWLMQGVLRFSDAENRIYTILKHLATYYGVPDSRGIIIPLPLTHQDIADYASLARETVSRVLRRISKRGQIEFIDNKKIRLMPSFSLPPIQGDRHSLLVE